MQKSSNSYIFRPVYQIDIKFDKQLWIATETLWVVSYGGKTIPRWRTAASLNIDISPYLSEKSSNILMKFCTQQQMLNWMNVTLSKSCIGQTPSSTERISCFLNIMSYLCYRHLINVTGLK